MTADATATFMQTAEPEILCDGEYHYERCAYESVEECQSGPSWHWNVDGVGGHCTSKCTCPS